MALATTEDGVNGYRDGYRTEEDYIESRRMVWRIARLQLVIAISGALGAAGWWFLR